MEPTFVGACVVLYKSYRLINDVFSLMQECNCWHFKYFFRN